MKNKTLLHFKGLLASLYLLVLPATAFADAPRWFAVDELSGDWEGIITLQNNHSWKIELSIQDALTNYENEKVQSEPTRLEVIRSNRQILSTGAVPQESPAVANKQGEVTATARKKIDRSQKKAEAALTLDKERQGLLPPSAKEFTGVIKFVSLNAGEDNYNRDTVLERREDSRGEIKVFGSMNPLSGEFVITHAREYLKTPRSLGYGRWQLRGVFNKSSPSLCGWAGGINTDYYSPFVFVPKGHADDSFYAPFDTSLDSVQSKENAAAIGESESAIDRAYDLKFAELINVKKQKQAENDKIYRSLLHQLKQDPNSTDIDIPKVDSLSEKTSEIRVRNRADDATPGSWNDHYGKISTWSAASNQAIKEWFDAENKKFEVYASQIKDDYQAERERIGNEEKSRNMALRSEAKERRSVLSDKRKSFRNELKEDPTGENINIPNSSEIDTSLSVKEQLNQWYKAESEKIKSWQATERASLKTWADDAEDAARKRYQQRDFEHNEKRQAIQDDYSMRKGAIRSKTQELVNLLQDDKSGSSLVIPEVAVAPSVQNPVKESESSPRTRVREWYAAVESQRKEWYEQAYKKLQKERAAEFAQANQGNKTALNFDAEKITQWIQSMDDENPELRKKSNYYLSELGPSYRNLLRDELFLPAFGVAFDDLDSDARDVLWRAFGGSPNDKGLTLPKEVTQGASSKLKEMIRRSYLYHLACLRLQRELDLWKQELIQSVKDTQPQLGSFRQLMAKEATAAIWLKHFRLHEQDAVSLVIDNAKHRIADEVIVARAKQTVKISKDESSLPRLLYFWNQQNDIYSYTSKNGRHLADTVIDNKIDTLVSATINRINEDLKNIGTGLGAIHIGSRWYAKLQSSLGAAMSRPIVATAVAELRKSRDKDLIKAIPEISARINDMTDNDTLLDFADSLLIIPGDKSTQAGQTIQTLVNKQLAANDLAAYMENFSAYEQSLMDEFGTIQVPNDYPKPTAEEIQLAIIREFARNGGRVLDKQTALHALLGLSDLKLFSEITISGLDLQGVGRDDHNGYLAYYFHRMTVEPRGSLQELMGAGSGMSGLIQYLYVMMDATELEVVHKFVLTPSGWASPSVRRSILLGTYINPNISERERTKLARDVLDRRKGALKK
ncbi:MAG TPA: hypothetical protein DCX06_07205 [Opitutae bacterium]|nr:hypothetical protein [Opitutae bacterium]